MAKYLRKAALKITPYYDDSVGPTLQQSAQGVEITSGGDTASPYLRVDISVSASVHGLTRTHAEVVVYGLGPATRGNLSQLVKPGFVLSAGWADDGQVSASNPCVIFNGVASRIVSQKVPTNYETHITGFESDALNTFISKSFARGITDRGILNFILSEMGVSLAPNADYILNSVLSPVPYATGCTLFAPAKKYLDQLSRGTITPKAQNPAIATHAVSAKAAAKPSTSVASSTQAPGQTGDPFDFSIINNQFWVSIPQCCATNTATVVSIDTGLIGSPSRKYDNKRKSDIFLSVRSLLDARFVPHTPILLESADFNGFFRILSVQHSGSTMGGPFISDLEVQAVVGASQSAGPVF